MDYKNVLKILDKTIDDGMFFQTKTEFCANGIILDCAPWWKASRDKTIKFSLTFSLGYRIGFLWGDLHPHGLSKSVYRSQSFHVQQYVGEGVELYKKIKKPPLFRLIHQQGIILSTFKPFSQARPGFHSLKSTVNPPMAAVHMTSMPCEP